MAAGEASNIISGDDANSPSTSHLYTLYFIRHAEALHNQLEKQAQSEALARAIIEGHDRNSAYAKKVQEEARRSILESDSITDPPLSEEGLKEAKNAKQTLETLIEMYNLPPVEEVWVSPLQRTLMTADVIFPEASSSDESSNHTSGTGAIVPKIKVKKEIEERQTGLACDTHTPLSNLRRRKTYQRFSLSCLRLDKLLVMDGIRGCSSMESIASIEEELANGDNSVWEDKQEEDYAVGYVLHKNKKTSSSKESATSSPAITKNNSDSSTSTSVVEDKMMLRERTKKLFNLLAETNSRSICLIGHKGYLRELEHGPLGMPESELFKNCEVRVYRLQLDIQGGDTADGAVSGNVEDVIDCDGKINNRETSPHRRDRSGSNAVLQRAEKIASSVHQS